MYEYAKYEFNEWLYKLDTNKLDPYQKRLIGLLIKHFDKINKISNEVQKMLRLHELVVLQKELPSCSLSGVLTPRLELSISYNMKNMVSNII